MNENYILPTNEMAPNGTKYCKCCGKQIAEKAVICPACGCQVEEIKNPNNNYGQPIIINNNNNNTSSAAAVFGVVVVGNAKNKWISFLLCFFLGFVGGHKFYEGKILMGILYLCTCGIFGIGVLVDLIIILCKPNPYFV